MRVINYITKAETYGPNSPIPYGQNPLLHYGYRGDWFDNSIKIKRDGAIYELTQEERNVCNDSIENIAAAHLCDSTLSVWNVLDSIVYNGVVYRTKYVNAYYLTDKDGRAVNNNQEHNSSLEKMVLPYNPNLKVSGFSNFSSLQEIVFKSDIIDCWDPDEDNEISFYDFCFSNCSALQKIALPEGMKKSTIGLFFLCSNLRYVRFPSTLRTLDSAFVGCTSLESPVLPDGLEELNLESFRSCYKITELDIPQSVTKLYNGSDIKNLEVIKLPNKEFLRKLYLSRSYNLKQIIIK